MKRLGIIRPLGNPCYWYASGYSFFFFITWSFWWSLYAIWLKSTIGLTAQQLGTIYALNQFVSLLFMFLYGPLQDKLGLKKHLMWIVGVILVATGPFLIYVYEPHVKDHFCPVIILGSVFFGMGYLAGSGLIDSFTEKMGRTAGFEYGMSRFWGSVGYAIGTFVAGTLFVINPHYNFWLASLAGIGFLYINARFGKGQSGQQETEETPTVTKRDFLTLLQDKNFWKFVFFITGTWSFYTLYDQQIFPVYYIGLFDNLRVATQTYSYLNSVQVILEAVCMALIPFFINRVGAKNALLLGTLIMAVRILMTALFTDPAIISFAKMFHALEVPLFVVSVFKYTAANFDKRLSCTIFLTGFLIANSIGIIALSFPLGMLLDKFGYQPVIYLISGVVVCVFGYGRLVLSEKR